MMNPVTGKTYACFELAPDYVVTKFLASRSINWKQQTVKAFHTDEGNRRSNGHRQETEESIMKAIRSLETGIQHLA